LSVEEIARQTQGFLSQRLGPLVAKYVAQVRGFASNWGFANWPNAGKTKPQIANLAIKTPGKTWGHPGTVDHVMM
jgi:hypothetical protein